MTKPGIRTWPDKSILFTEGCQEGFKQHAGDWKTAERYGRNIIGNLNNWVAGFTDWNIVLDETGGRFIEVSRHGGADRPRELGRAAGLELLDKGAAEIIARTRPDEH